MRLILLALISLMAGTAYGQYYEKLYLVNWSVNQPLSNRDFVNKVSTRGVRVGYRELINEKVAAGIDLNSNSYRGYEDRQTYVSNGGAITTDFFKYVTSYGATFVLEYYFLTESKIMPYAGVGLGAAHNKFDVFYNLYSTSEGSWGFLARPQVGAWMKLGPNSSWAMHGSVQADIATTKSTDFDYHNFNSVGIQIGFVYTDW